jgi:hypothetical protein
VMRAWGYTYDDIIRLETENRRFRFALNTIVGGSFGREPPRSIREARRIALKALMKK